MKVLSMEEIREKAPAVFAKSPSPDVGHHYTMVPTFKMLELLMKEGYVPVEAKQKGKSLYSKHMLKLQHVDSLKTKEVTDVGTLIPQVLMINAHDTTCSYRFMMGIFRLVCSNGLIVSDGPVENRVFRHVSAEEETLVGIEDIMSYMPEVLDNANEMRNIALPASEMRLFAEEAAGLRFNFEINPDLLLVPRRSEDEGNDLWSVFSRVQENLTKGGFEVTNKRPVTAKEISNIDQDISINRGLWSLASRYKEQKVH